MMTFHGSTRAAVKAIKSYMRRRKQRCIAAASKAVEPLGHEGACVNDAASLSNRHIIISFVPSTNSGCSIEHRGRDAHSSVIYSIHIHLDPSHTSAGGAGGAERNPQRDVVSHLCAS